MEIKDLESKIWFRFLKLIFVFAYVATLLAVLVFAYTSKPYSINDEYNSKIVCDNGKEYKAGDSGIDAEEAWAEQLGATRVDLNGATPAKDKATNLCLGYPQSFVPDKLTPRLTESQLKENIDALLSQNASKQETQEYVDRYKSDGLGGYVLKQQTPPYQVELVKKTVGNWWSFIGYVILALFIVSVIFELIRRSFFYVAIGEKFLK